MSSDKRPLYDELGGRPTLERVHKIFYDKIYADVWIGQFFKHVSQDIIERQQTDFMAQAMGGPDEYCGAFPIPAHKHMNIPEDLFEHRHALLKASLDEAMVPTNLAQQWLRIDAAFRNGLVKQSLADCKPRFPTDTILDFPNPGARFKNAA